VLGTLALGGCGARRPASFAGCWQLGSTAREGPLGIAPGFALGRVRLDTVANRKLARWHLASADDMDVEPIGPMSLAGTRDTAVVATFWRVTGRSAIALVRTSAFSGVRLTLRRDGDSLAGTGRTFVDLPGVRLSQWSVGARRIPCEPPAALARAEVESALVHYDSLVRRVAGDSIAALYTPDGELLGTGQRTIRGRDSIRAFLASFSNVRVDSARMTSLAVSVLGDEAVQWGTYEQTATIAKRPPVHVTGRFVADWVREPAVGWRLRRMLAQPAPPDR